MTWRGPRISFRKSRQPGRDGLGGKGEEWGTRFLNNNATPPMTATLLVQGAREGEGEGEGGGGTGENGSDPGAYLLLASAATAAAGRNDAQVVAAAAAAASRNKAAAAAASYAPVGYPDAQADAVPRTPHDAGYSPHAGYGRS